MAIRVRSRRYTSYDIHIAADLVSSAEVSEKAGGGVDRWLDRLGLNRPWIVVSSPAIWRHWGRQLDRSFRGTTPLLIPDGERAKHLGTVARVYEGLLERGARRQTPVIVIGGGVLGDLAGFAAATYFRGLPLVHVPTTLVAQVDSAIGGKVGVNLPAGKNLVGAFYPPRAVLVDPTFCSTLPTREFRSGLFEVIKYGAIGAPRLFDRLTALPLLALQRDARRLTPIIETCCRLKATVVTADEQESGLRRILNFGHTVGHALEAVTAYRRFRHGEAVGLGMLAATDISVARGLLAEDRLATLTTLVRSLGALPKVTDLSAADVVRAAHHDKKRTGRHLTFVLLRDIGQTVVADEVRPGEVSQALRRLGLAR